MNYLKITITCLYLLCCAFSFGQQQVTQGEYFWDTDPGQGFATPLLAVDGNFNSALEEVYKNVTTLPGLGAHTLNVRIKDVDGNWSPIFKTSLTVLPATEPSRNTRVVQAEYFWDTDPGEGSATPLLALDGNFNSVLETVYENVNTLPSLGAHTLNVRIKDVDGNWSPIFKTSITVLPATEPSRNTRIVQAEYFWDTDPGEGSATALLALDGNFNSVLETVYENINTLPSIGAHSLNVRIKDVDGNWSPIFKTSITVIDTVPPSRDIKIVQGELFFDTDPGYGAGMPLLALDGNFNSAFEQAFAQGLPLSIDTGLHAMHVRIKDVDGNWSPDYVTVIKMDTTIYELSADIIEGDTLFCENANLTNQLFVGDLNPSASYVWEVTNGTILSGQGNDSVYVTWNGTFPASIKLKMCDGVNCDSNIYSINTKPLSFTAIYDTICAGNTYDFNGTLYSLSGIYKDTIIGGAANGCDSIITLDLTINNPANSVDVQVACESYTWIDGNTYTTSNNTAKDTIVGGAANGCDSIITLNLTINNPINSVDVQVACESYTWIDGNTYTSSNNTAKDTIVGGAANGCDSIITLNLTINNPINSVDVQVACESYTWIDGNTYTTSNNTAKDTIVGGAANGCDSIITLDLTINNPANSVDVQVACESYTWIDGNTYTSSNNTAKDTIVGGASNGCDSIITLNLTINNPVNSVDVQVACESYTWIDGNTYTTSNNTAKDTIIGGAANGCDSIITLDLTIDTINKTTTLSGTTITSSQSGGTYQWLDCDNDTIITGENGQSYTANTTGNYAVIVTFGTCLDTSNCVLLSTTSYTKESLTNNILVYPNPSSNKITISNITEKYYYQLFSANGTLIQEGDIQNNEQINISNLSNGIYLLKANNKSDDHFLKRIVVNK